MTIRFKFEDGEILEIETVSDLETVSGMKLEPDRANGYVETKPKECLCCASDDSIDLAVGRIIRAYRLEDVMVRYF